MANLEQLTALIEPIVTDAGFELVRVALIEGPSLTLQIMLEDPATGQMKVDDCARVSRKISLLLDETDPIDSEYMLEVSSPGIDRPLTRLKDFDRWAGHDAKLELAEAIPMNGADRKRFQGPLKGTSGEDIRIEVEGLGEVALPFAAIRTAKLLLTDRLIAETATLLTDEGADEFDEFEDDSGDEPDQIRN
ncbi:ribosome maturation factor RimP [Sandaracinobacter neustonicus]|uniref:Ribosome maturation factor RimP n=1 Tax=Sandaracinobacter neustonicus TaxID=1715348 RepID=A0A501XEE5_9SPHN|nr:ribosome maturation factor RimP [Sandaracinobacter neustonicus]TPE58697.1 ribosome maturation factor RimP [Sandaracinobacter neustonicus]